MGRTKSHKNYLSGMVGIKSDGQTVVDVPGQVKITEFFGNASTNPLKGSISVAHVKSKAGFAEDWQTPDFDEYVLVLSGQVRIEHSHGPGAVVNGGQAIFLAK